MLKYFISKNKKVLMTITAILLLILNGIIIIATAEEEKANLTLTIDDLTIEKLDVLKEGENIIIPVKVINNGDKNITTSDPDINIVLRYKNQIVATNSSDKGLDIDKERYINLSWTPDYNDVGINYLEIEVDPTNQIPEIQYNDNFWGKYTEIQEGDISLEIVSITVFNQAIIGQKTDIQIGVKNYGKNTDDTIIVKQKYLNKDETTTVSNEDGINRDETIYFNFEWTPKLFGEQTLEYSVLIDETNYDTDEISLTIDINQLPWWNINWHYRQLFVTDGVGNISIELNFTDLLEEIGVLNEVFENDTIRIIQYKNNGEVEEVIDVYQFIQDEDYDNITNAKGKLNWKVTGEDEKKYFCIYFDCKNNIGFRDYIQQTNNTNQSGNIVVDTVGFLDGWSSKVVYPDNNSYFEINTDFELIVSTSSKIVNVSADFFYEDTFIKTDYLNNKSENIQWNTTIDFFDTKGIWKILINCSDNTSYTCGTLEHFIQVSQPDFEVYNMSFETNWQETSPIIYKNDTVAINSVIKCYNASVNNVNINLVVKNDEDIIIHSDDKIKNLVKDVNNSVEFSWFADFSGDVEFIITVDNNDEFNETDETNNEYSVEKTVYEWPDLSIIDIILPADSLNEGDDVPIDIVINNKADVYADDYELLLFIEPSSQNIMKYQNDVDKRFFDIGKNTSETYTMNWDDASAGEWLVGAIINISEDKRDVNSFDNRYLSSKYLTINTVFKYSPSIINIIADPGYQEQYKTVLITSDIIDQIGVEIAILTVFSPSDIKYEYTMYKSDDNSYWFDFKETDELGEYYYEISADSQATYSTIALRSGIFNIIRDATKPNIDFLNAEPYVQKIDEKISIICIASDEYGIEKVKITIYPPGSSSYSRIMNEVEDGKYVYTTNFQTTGKYKYSIEVSDTSDNIKQSDTMYFWISEDISDADNDGIPDWWEEKYNLNPYDPKDADLDDDNDGFTNLREYEEGFNPQRNLLMQNAAQRIQDNAGYLSGSIIIFIFLLIIIFYFSRRRQR